MIYLKITSSDYNVATVMRMYDKQLVTVGLSQAELLRMYEVKNPADLPTARLFKAVFIVEVDLYSIEVNDKLFTLEPKYINRIVAINIHTKLDEKVVKVYLKKLGATELFIEKVRLK